MGCAHFTQGAPRSDYLHRNNARGTSQFALHNRTKNIRLWRDKFRLIATGCPWWLIRARRRSLCVTVSKIVVKFSNEFSNCPFHSLVFVNHYARSPDSQQFDLVSLTWETNFFQCKTFFEYLVETFAIIRLSHSFLTKTFRLKVFPRSCWSAKCRWNSVKVKGIERLLYQ